MTLEYALEIAPQFYPLAAVLGLIILFIIMAWKLGRKNNKILSLTENAVHWENTANNERHDREQMKVERDKKIEAHKLIGKDMRALRKERAAEEAAHQELVEDRDRYKKMVDIAIHAHDQINLDDKGDNS